MSEYGLELGGVRHRHATTLKCPIHAGERDPEGVPEEFPTPDPIVRTGSTFL